MLLPHIRVSLCSCRTAGDIILVLVRVTARATDQMTFCIHVIVSPDNGTVYVCVWYPPSHLLHLVKVCVNGGEKGAKEWRDRMRPMCQVILVFFCMWGWCNHQSPLTDPLQTEFVTLWMVSYCVLGRDKVCPRSGSWCHGDNGGKQRLAETGLPFSSPFPQEH